MLNTVVIMYLHRRNYMAVDTQLAGLQLQLIIFVTPVVGGMHQPQGKETRALPALFCHENHLIDKNITSFAG